MSGKIFGGGGGEHPVEERERGGHTPSVMVKRGGERVMAKKIETDGEHVNCTTGAARWARYFCSIDIP